MYYRVKIPILFDLLDFQMQQTENVMLIKITHKIHVKKFSHVWTKIKQRKIYPQKSENITNQQSRPKLYNFFNITVIYVFSPR